MRGKGRTHPCYALGCGRLIAVDLLMCKRHWLRVPKEIRKKVWAEHSRGFSHAYLAAIKEAKASLRPPDERSAVAS